MVDIQSATAENKRGKKKKIEEEEEEEEEEEKPQDKNIMTCPIS